MGISENKMNAFEESIQILYMDSASDMDGFFEALAEIDSEFGVFFGDDNGIKKSIENIIRLFYFPITIIYEPYYVDRVYRDEYYRYYSKKHFHISRNTKRFIFINGIYAKTDFLSDDEQKYESIKEDLIGTVVSKPTQTIGRTLLRPSKLKIPRCYIRTTAFEMMIYGKLYPLQAFPFSGQDSEVMTCAEVNIWQIMEYFGSRYKDYKTLLPSELMDLVKENSDSRILPSDGLTVEQESSLFMKNGLSPLIYYKHLDYIEEDSYKVYEACQDPSFLDILHFYVESGMPVLINLRERDNPKGDNHSITCIGHEYVEPVQLLDRMEKNIIEIGKEELDKRKTVKYNEICIYQSWSGYKKYVLLEDHSSPYQVLDLENLTFDDFQDEKNYWEIESFVVPLYKHVFVSAEDAYGIFLSLIKENFEGISNAIGNDLQSCQPEIVIRMYLATSRSFKDFRVKHTLNSSSEGLNEKLFFSQIAYPKFVWVCEYGTKESYSDSKANGEFILDATSPKGCPVISIRHGGVVTYRRPDKSEADAFKPLDIKLMDRFTMYKSNNLKDSSDNKRREADRK